MLEIKYIRENLDDVEKAFLNRGASIELDAFQKWDEERRAILFEIEALRHRRNVVSDQIAQMKKNGENADDLVGEMRRVAAKIKELQKPLLESEKKINELLMRMPNIPHATVPVGKDDADNPVIKTVGEPIHFDFDPKPHWTLGEQLGILDFDRAAKISGARFPLYYGAGAKLERIGAGKANVRYEAKGRREVGIGFPGEADNEIGTQRDVRPRRA